MSYVPEFLLKKAVLDNFPSGEQDPAVADSIDFMVEQVFFHFLCFFFIFYFIFLSFQWILRLFNFFKTQVEKLTQPQIASRFKLNVLENELGPNQFVDEGKVTIIDVILFFFFWLINWNQFNSLSFHLWFS